MKDFFLHKIILIVLFILPLVSISQKVKIESNETYRERIAAIKSPIELVYREEVKTYIDNYLNNPDATRQLLIRGRKYFPLMEKALRQKGVPIDLKYVAAAASNLDLFRSGPNGETGLWMMMYNVSKMYKGKVNTYVDERRDPVKSSQMAASHFKDLNAIYFQWPLSITAYGVSPFTLNKAIRRASNSLFFWDVYEYLPEQARDLYPRFIATIYIFNYYKEHGMVLPVQTEVSTTIDSVLVNKWLSFEQISKTIDLPIEQLRVLNPIFKKDIIPFTAEGYWIYIPGNKMIAFEALKDSVYNPNPTPETFEPVVITKDSSDTLNQKPNKPSPPVFDKKKLYYTVKKGDNLGDIAKWYDVTVSEIKSWNKLKGNTINAGQRLIIWVKASKSGYYNRINKMSRAQKNKLK